ncbi:uncharacterized protein Fot_19068 [Forsythia ovata]|uniref:DUF4408 domain-containing protein n=1 Tax=Forsythia ovata TaxID=205694 RepID=A0ABD1VK19_9LAMI
MPHHKLIEATGSGVGSSNLYIKGSFPTTKYFRGISVTLISPRFVFVLGNVILVVLLMQSGQFAAKDGHKNSYKIDFYDEYIKNCGNNQQKQKLSSTHDGRKVTSDANISRERKIHRTHSENLERQHQDVPNRHEFRRSITETCRKSVNHSHNPRYQTRKLVFESKKQMNLSYAEDEMSSEEFRRTVEEFIARQQRNLREK